MSEPRLSVVVPTRNRPERLRACLAALGRAVPPAAGVEVVIADDGGDVDSAEAQAAAGSGVAVRVVRSGGAGPAAARNAGAAAAAAALLAFTDDDCEPEPGWAAALLERHRQAPQALLGGRTVNALPDNPYARAAQTIADSALEHHNRRPGAPRFFASSNIALPAEGFARLGGFAEDFPLAGGEDRDLCERWLEQGWRLVAAPDAVVRHFHALDLGAFWRQQAAYGAGARRHRRARASRTGNRRLEPALTSGVFAIAARRSLAARDPASLALLGVWQAANLYGFAREALRERREKLV